MATPFLLDAFDGPDSQFLESYSANWVRSTNQAGRAMLLGGRVYQSNTDTTVYCRDDVQPPTADYDVSASLYFATGSGSPSVGVCGRMAGPGGAALTFYQARIVNNGSGIVLARFINGATVTLSSVAYSAPAGAEPKLTLRMKGDQLTVLLDGVVVIGPITDGNITAAGYAGFRMASASANQIRIDNFAIEPVEEIAASIAATLSATLEAAEISSAAQTGVRAALSRVLAQATLASAATFSSTAGLTKTLSPAVLAASAYIEAEPPAADGIEGALSKMLDGAKLAATASVATRCELSSTLAGPALAATARTAKALDISKVHFSRIVVFGGSGTRVVVFAGSGSRVVVFEGSGKRIRINEMDVKVPIKDGEKWKVDRDRDEISYYAADISEELRDRNTTAVQSEVVALPYGVEVLEEAEIQVATIEGIERTFVVVKLGGVDGELPDDWRWVARVPCANGERFDKTTWFNEVDP
jgi:hypothetical protein